ncbi:MAG: class I SAM-dependent methyltransferase, partial [Patescibacteria group bacterium]
MGNDRDKEINLRDFAQVYRRDAAAFHGRAPELVTYRHIVAPALRRYLGEYFPILYRRIAHVLDIGSASGRNVHTLMGEGFSAENILGVEISPDQVEIASREIPGATFEIGDISSHTLIPNYNELAIMIMVPEFLDDGRYPRALDNISASMKNGGVFVYITTH